MEAAGGAVLLYSPNATPTGAYPKGVGDALAVALAHLPGPHGEYLVETATLANAEGKDGLGARLDAARVLVCCDDSPPPQAMGNGIENGMDSALVERIVQRVETDGMGIVFLHDAHRSPLFQALLQASGAWANHVEDGGPQNLHVAQPTHPIARGIRDFVIPQGERFVEPFLVPTPEAVVFDTATPPAEAPVRLGLCWTRGQGRVFYFAPGGADHPVYAQPEIVQVLRNAVLWAARDPIGIAIDNDPGARAAHAAGDPALSEICARLGYAGTDITAPGEIRAAQWVRAQPGMVRAYALAAYGPPQECSAGWYGLEKPDKRETLWKIDGKNNRQDDPTLSGHPRIPFDPHDSPFGLWVASKAFPKAIPNAIVYMDDARNVSSDASSAANAAFAGGQNMSPHRTRIYPAISSSGRIKPNAYILGWDYSGRGGFQDLVMVLENVRPVAAP